MRRFTAMTVGLSVLLALPLAPRAGQEEQFTPEFKEVRSSYDAKHTPKLAAPDAVKRGQWFDVTVTVAELIPERQRARLTCTCKVGDEIVLDGEALVKVPSAAKSKRPLPRI